MPITVNVGEISQCDQTNEIRTRGCDPCVALIVIYDAGNGHLVKRCAHFSVGIAGQLTQARINTSLDPILTAHFPLQQVQSVHFTWGGHSVGMGGNLICTRLSAYFAAHNPIQSALNDSVSSNGANVAFSNLSTWPFTNVPPQNLNAEIK